MRQRLAYMLKHNLLLQKIYKVCMSAVFRFLGLFTTTDQKLVLFSSFMGSKFNDSPRAIYDYMQQHPEYQAFRCIWAMEKPEDYPQLQTVKIDTPRYFMTALRAKYWVTNTNIERGLSFKKKKTVYLNTWHGVALKTIGNDCPGRKDYNFNSVDYLCVSADHDERVFRSAFHAKQQCYLRCGMPRNDALWKATAEQAVAIRAKLGIPTDKKVILYAPTWRESEDGGQSYAIKPPVDFAAWQERLGGEYIVLFRAHHITTKVLNVQFNDFVWDVSGYPDVNDLLIAADMLITDYSAIAFDYSILCRPLLCYAYDYDTYLANRGTYFDIDEKYPMKACRTEPELLECICAVDYEKESANTRKFRNEFIRYGGSATDCCVKALFQ